jgi:hypothetical protein
MPIIREQDSGNKFRVLRGFPEEGTLFLDMKFAPDAQIEFGDPVALDAQGLLVKAKDGASTIGFAYGDTNVPNNMGSKKITVLMGQFIAETEKYNKSNTYAPGDALTVKDGVLDKAGDGDKAVGKVLAVDPARQRLTFVYIPEV